MPTALFAHHQHHAFRQPTGDDGDDVHYIHPSYAKALYIISEHDFVHSLIHSKRVACAKPSPQHLPLHHPHLQSNPNHNRNPRVLSSRRTPAARPPKRQPRPLMTTFSAYPSAANMALSGGPPGSPPDLTNSKSSKSSSLHSSNISDVMGPGDLSHFEDINLDDIQGPGAFPIPLSPSHRVLFESSRPAPPTSRNSAPHSFRDLTGGKKPRNLNLAASANNAAARSQTQLNAPGQLRRGFTSPSAPMLTNVSSLAAPGRRSRSPSPANSQRSFTSAPRTLSRKSSRTQEISPSSTPMNPRRQSWQTAARKTAKEREAECDDEGDDDLPEDAIIWNVPISPRPVQERSPAASSCGSPPNDPSPLMSRPTSSRENSLSAKTSPAPSDRRASSQPPPIPEDKEDLPPSQPLSRQRTQTWQTTYTTLDADAKKLTEALEEYQTEIEQQEEIKRQQTGLSRSVSVDRPVETKRKAVSLPPIRKSDPLIDPFQPSVEKTKYLSRTRPSWLPPKDPKEEKKHLKEYQRMLARIEEAERLEAERQAREAESREKAERIKAEYWSTLLLPNWDTEMVNPELKGSHRKMWWNGIPPKLRGAVWKRAIANELEVTAATYSVALKKAKIQIKDHADAAFSGRYAKIIENSRTVFPELKMFAPKTEESPEQPLHEELINICIAYSAYRPDVDTTNGIHHIAALFLLNMSAADSFITLSNLLNRPLPLSFLIRDPSAITAAYDTTLHALSQKAPSLATRLAELRAEPYDYLLSMYSSLFCDRLSVEHAARLMDVYTVEGDKIPPRVAVALMTMLETSCLSGSAEDVVKVLREKPIRATPDEFMGKVYEAGKSS